MGDISAEPSMEEILSSIKRIIAEEGDGSPPRARRPQRPVPPLPAAEPEEVLELSEPMPQPRLPEPSRGEAPRRIEPLRPEAVAPQPQAQHQPQHQPQQEPARPADPIVSQAAAAASRGSLEALSRLIVKPDAPQGVPQGDVTLEGLVREMLRPMLREWLDARLPEMVEAMVAREIERITGSPQP